MMRRSLDPILCRLRMHHDAVATDGQLLERYLATRDEAAFEALVQRHGPMVLGVCRRIAPSRHDAEDAFQATFLVLVRKAASIRPRDLVGNWLYGVAYRAGLKARAAAGRQHARERPMCTLPEPATVEMGLWQDLLPLLDQELQALPEKYRQPIVLCDLEGKTRKDAARHLGWPEGTVAGRLAQARSLLAKRLARRGLPVSGGVLGAVLSQSALSATVPATLASSTVKVASLAAAGPTAAAGVISAKVAGIADGVAKLMLIGKLKSAVFSRQIRSFLITKQGTILSEAGASYHSTCSATASSADRQASV